MTAEKPAALAVVPQAREEFSPADVALIKSQICPPGTTDDELRLFLMYCQRTGMDPFARQIYLSERRSFTNGQWVVTRKPETTIDGFRLISERSGQYAGQLGPFWCDKNGEWRDVWTEEYPPVAAQVGVLRHDFKEPLWGKALYREYVQTNKDGHPTSMWKKMPSGQLAKCAEALALRKAFPRELSGLYAKEEMPDAAVDAREAQVEVAESKIKQLKAAATVPQGEPRHQAFADIDPEPSSAPAAPEPQDGGYEARATAQAAEAQAQLPTPRKKREPGDPFDYKLMLAQFEQLKGLIAKDYDVKMYYEVLGGEGLKHANEIRSEAQGKRVYKLLLERFKSERAKRANREEIEDLRAKHPQAFADACFECGLTPEQILNEATEEQQMKFLDIQRGLSRV